MDYRINNSHYQEEKRITRRDIIKLGLVTVAAAVVPHSTVDAAAYILSDSRSLSFYNLHTKEHFDAAYWVEGKYIPASISSIEHIFRDHYNGRVRPINTKLLDLLYEIRKKLGTSDPFHLISGYRSPDTNARLRSYKKGVAKKSLHMYGMAADIRMPGHSLKKLRRAAYSIKKGGLGYYPRSNFVHVDVGRVRYW